MDWPSHITKDIADDIAGPIVLCRLGDRTWGWLMSVWYFTRERIHGIASLVPRDNV